MLPLTDLTVSNLKPPEKGQKSYWDTTVRGFGIRVSCGGSKSWVVQVGAQRKLITLARYPQVSLKDARIAAKLHLSGPPDLTKSVSLNQGIEAFLKHVGASKRERTLKSYRTSLNRHFTNQEGRLRSQTTDKVMEIVDSLAATPSEQLHFFNIARTMFNFCVRSKMLQANPLANVPSPAKRNTRDRVLSDTELAQIWRAADTCDETLAKIIQICILTGVRRGEVSKLEWSYIDQERRTITLPSSITKNHVQHHFPYGDMLQRVLDTFTVQEGKLFPGRTAKNEFFEGWSRGKENFDKACPVTDWTLHDLRRTYYTNMAALGVPPHVCAKLVNHVSGAHVISGISAVYNRHLYLDEMREAVTKWEARLCDIITV